MVSEMKELARKRGRRAEKLFTKISDLEFEDMLAAITLEEAHRTDPATFPRSGKDDFYRLCWKAITKDKATPGDPSNGLADWEISAFIDDMWNATMGSRRAQEAKPCW